MFTSVPDQTLSVREAPPHSVSVKPVNAEVRSSGVGIYSAYILTTEGHIANWYASTQRWLMQTLKLIATQLDEERNVLDIFLTGS